MKQNSERTPNSARVPLIVVEGKRLIRKSAQRAGETASRVAQKGRRLVGNTVYRTERLTRRNPWVGLGAALCTGACVGALCTFLYFRIR